MSTPAKSEEEDACAFCWVVRKEVWLSSVPNNAHSLQVSNDSKCVRSAEGCCRRCVSRIAKSDKDHASYIGYPTSLNLPAVRQLLHPTSTLTSPAMPHICSADSGSLTLRIRRPKGNILTLELPLHQPFTIENSDLVQILDDFIEKHFSARLLERAATTENHLRTDNDDLYNIGAEVKYLLVSRLSELVTELLEAIQPLQDPDLERQWMHNAYAASVVLHCELYYYFKRALRDSILKTNAVDIRLMENIHQGCGKIRRWQTPIDGCLKNLRRSPTPLRISMILSLPSSIPKIIVGSPNQSPLNSMASGQQPPVAPLLCAPHVPDTFSGESNLLPSLSNNIGPPGVSVNLFDGLLPSSAHFDHLDFQEWSVTNNFAWKATEGHHSLSESASLLQAPVFQDWTSTGGLRPISYDSDPDAWCVDNEMSSCVKDSDILNIPGTTSETSSNGRNLSVVEDIFQDINFQDWDDLANGLVGSMENANSMVATDENEVLYAAKESQLGVATHTLLTAPEDEILGLSAIATNQDQHTTQATPNLPQWTDPFKAYQDPFGRVPSSHHSSWYNEPGELQDVEPDLPDWEDIIRFDETLN